VIKNSALIFGANGQDGFYLSQFLHSKGIEVTGVSRTGNWINGDVADKKFVNEVIKTIQPGFIFHLAANSSTSYEVWEENHHTICDGTMFILDAVKKESAHSKVFVSGSGLQFINKGQRIHETDEFEARDPYSVSRIHSAYAARYYRYAGIQAYVGYLFNHESPYRSERHISQKLASAARRISQGSEEKIRIGEITTRKEWGFAGDIVKGIWQLVTQEEVFEAVIGTGLGYTIEDWLNECFEIIGKDWRDYVLPIDGFQAEYRELISNPSTMESLGWKSEVSFKALAKLMVA
jgi:GDPmannose 4,6-dehydratase